MVVYMDPLGEYSGSLMDDLHNEQMKRIDEIGVRPSLS